MNTGTKEYQLFNELQLVATVTTDMPQASLEKLAKQAWKEQNDASVLLKKDLSFAEYLLFCFRESDLSRKYSLMVEKPEKCIEIQLA